VFHPLWGPEERRSFLALSDIFFTAAITDFFYYGSLKRQSYVDSVNCLPCRDSSDSGDGRYMKTILIYIVYLANYKELNIRAENIKCLTLPPIQFANLLTISLLQHSTNYEALHAQPPCKFFISLNQEDKGALPPCNAFLQMPYYFAQIINN